MGLPTKTFLLSTALKITTVIPIATATSVKIKIEDPSNMVEVDNADMTKEADGVYTYIWQTVDDNDAGDYRMTITVTYSGYTSVTQEKITLVDPTYT